MYLFVSSFVLAIAFCAPPGVVTAETVRRGFARGFWSALSVQIGSVIGDATWATLAIAGAAVLIQNWIVRLVLSLVGICFLGHLAFKAFKDARLETALGAAPASERGDFATGMLLSLSNPFAIAFWVSVGTSIFVAVPGTPQLFHYATFYTAFFLGVILWCFFMAGLVAWGRRFVTPAFFRWVNIACGLALGLFALQLGWQLLQNI
ncbi:MAG TPA: LysE family transporter [Anaerolineales bacterium]|jgi:chemosensory pili system protein ChpE